MRRYPAYKDSEVEWLGEVPSTWEVSRVKSLFEIKKRIVGELGHDVLSVTQNGIRVRDTESNDGQVSMDYSKYQIVEPDDFVMNHMDLLTGYVDISRFQGVTSPDYRVFTARHSELSSRYFLYLFQNGYRQRIFYAFGQGASEFGRWRMPTDNFNDFKMPLPTLPEQTAIAAFLDRETAKIDALVGEQRRLIDLLREKRQAVISHAVTKGLNPNAPLKPSGIDWLGDVPEGWEVGPLKRFVRYQEGPGIMAADFHESGIPLMRISGVQGRWTTLDGCNFLDPELVEKRWSHFRLELGDLVISASASMGTISEVPEDCVGSVPYTGLIRLKAAGSEITRDFIRGFLASDFFLTQIDQLKAGAMIQHFGPTHLGQVRIAVPPRRDQEMIAEYVADQSTKLDTLTATAETAIALLQERRAALISAAVTGKIEVCHLVQKEDEAA